MSVRTASGPRACHIGCVQTSGTASLLVSSHLQCPRGAGSGDAAYRAKATTRPASHFLENVGLRFMAFPRFPGDGVRPRASGQSSEGLDRPRRGTGMPVPVLQPGLGLAPCERGRPLTGWRITAEPLSVAATRLGGTVPALLTLWGRNWDPGKLNHIPTATQFASSPPLPVSRPCLWNLLEPSDVARDDLRPPRFPCCVVDTGIAKPSPVPLWPPCPRPHIPCEWSHSDVRRPGSHATAGLPGTKRRSLSPRSRDGGLGAPSPLRVLGVLRVGTSL